MPADWLILDNMKHSAKTVYLTALATLWCLPACAATIYKSIDENGVVQFSDTRPRDEIVVETLEIEEAVSPPAGQAQQRLEDMRETTDRMVADRMARERHRAELRQLDAQTNAQRDTQDTPDYLDTSPVYLGYYNYPAARPWPRWPPHHRRPEQPITYPPLRPQVEQRSSGMRPLPGNDYPGSLIRKSYDPKVREAFER
jgi:hypothetical protein